MKYVNKCLAERFVASLGSYKVSGSGFQPRQITLRLHISPEPYNRNEGGDIHHEHCIYLGKSKEKQ